MKAIAKNKPQLAVSTKVVIQILLFALGLLSCSKNEHDEVIPDYVGTWDRKWDDENSDLSYKQILGIKKDNFSSEIFIKNDDSWNPWVKFEGNYIVIDNTLEAWIQKVGKISGGTEMEYTLPDDPDFEETIKENIGIGSNFIGTYEINPRNTLSLALDYNGDRISGGFEGETVFFRVEE